MKWILVILVHEALDALIANSDQTFMTGLSIATYNHDVGNTGPTSYSGGGKRIQ